MVSTGFELEKLNREFLKSKPNEKNLKKLLKKKNSSNQKIPPDIFKYHSDFIMATLKEHAAEDSIEMSIKNFNNAPRLQAVKPGEIYFGLQSNKRGDYDPNYINCIVKDMYGQMHTHAIPIPTDLRNQNVTNEAIVPIVEQYIKNKGYVLSNTVLKQNAQLALEDYYFNLAQKYLTKANDPYTHASESALLLEMALEAALHLSSEQNDFNQNFKEMIFNAQLYGLAHNIVAPLSESTQNTLLQSHKNLELSRGILRTTQQQYNLLHPSANPAIPSPVAHDPPQHSVVYTPTPVSPVLSVDTLKEDMPSKPRLK